MALKSDYHFAARDWSIAPIGQGIQQAVGTIEQRQAEKQKAIAQQREKLMTFLSDDYVKPLEDSNKLIANSIIDKYEQNIIDLYQSKDKLTTEDWLALQSSKRDVEDRLESIKYKETSFLDAQKAFRTDTEGTYDPDEFTKRAEYYWETREVPEGGFLVYTPLDWEQSLFKEFKPQEVDENLVGDKIENTYEYGKLEDIVNRHNTRLANEPRYFQGLAKDFLGLDEATQNQYFEKADEDANLKDGVEPSQQERNSAINMWAKDRIKQRYRYTTKELAPKYMTDGSGSGKDINIIEEYDNTLDFSEASLNLVGDRQVYDGGKKKTIGFEKNRAQTVRIRKGQIPGANIVGYYVEHLLPTPEVTDAELLYYIKNNEKPPSGSVKTVYEPLTPTLYANINRGLNKKGLKLDDISDFNVKELEQEPKISVDKEVVSKSKIYNPSTWGTKDTIRTYSIDDKKYDEDELIDLYLQEDDYSKYSRDDIREMIRVTYDK